jgi:hypothetical protein
MSPWIPSAPAASTAGISSANRPKSTGKIDGATMTGLCGAASGMAALNEMRTKRGHCYFSVLAWYVDTPGLGEIRDKRYQPCPKLVSNLSKSYTPRALTLLTRLKTRIIFNFFLT